MKKIKGKSFLVIIEREKLIQQDKKIRRDRMIEFGVNNIHKNKTMRSKKDYTRKPRHRFRFV